MSDHYIPGQIREAGVNPTATVEWTVRPVHKKDGTEWPGIGYISDGNRTYGSANFEEGKAIVAAINAALAAEREKWMKLCDKTSDNATKAEQQLAAERKSNAELTKLVLKVERDVGTLVDALKLARQCAESGSLCDTIDAALAKVGK